MSFEITFLTLLLIAACSDLLTRKIPNALNFTMIISGVIVASLGMIPTSWSDSLLGVLSALGVLLVPFALRVYQGGDVKLCMGMGAWLGVYGVLWSIGLGVVGGGLLALLFKLKALRSRQSTRNMTVPMAVSFATAGAFVWHFGSPPW